MYSGEVKSFGGGDVAGFYDAYDTAVLGNNGAKAEVRISFDEVPKDLIKLVKARIVKDAEVKKNYASMTEGVDGLPDFEDLLIEAESEDHFAVSKYISTIARKVNPNDRKNWVTIHLKQSKGETKEFVIDYLVDQNGDGVSTNTWNDISDKIETKREIAEHHTIGVRKMTKGWKITTKVGMLKGKYKDEYKDNQKITSEELLKILKELPLGRD